MSFTQTDRVTAVETDTYQPSQETGSCTSLESLEGEDDNVDSALQRLREDIEQLHNETTSRNRRRRQQYENRIAELENQLSRMADALAERTSQLEREQAEHRHTAEAMEHLQHRLADRQHLIKLQSQRYDRLKRLLPRHNADKEPFAEALLGTIAHIAVSLGLNEKTDLGRIDQVIGELLIQQRDAEESLRNLRQQLQQRQAEVDAMRGSREQDDKTIARLRHKLTAGDDRLQQICNRWQGLVEYCDAISDLLIDATSKTSFAVGHGLGTDQPAATKDLPAEAKHQSAETKDQPATT